MATSIECSHYGVTSTGIAVDKYTLCNNNGVAVSVINYGGIITSFKVPDSNGDPVDIVLGYDDLAHYESCEFYMGCIVGRYANRIANSGFQLDGNTYSLERNEGGHHLHGGRDGFHKVVWEARVNDPRATGSDRPTSAEPDHATHPGVSDACALILSHTSADGAAGYPGTLLVTVEFSLSDHNELRLDYMARTDTPTIVNLTSHSYFNLQGHRFASANGIFDHQLQMAAESYLPTDHGVPLSAQRVTGTPMDFLQPTVIGSAIREPHPQLRMASGFDHNWMLAPTGSDLRFAARLSEPGGNMLEVFTSQPGLQCYTANHLHNCRGKGGALYGPHGAVCLETQHFPDSPNRPEFPSTILRPGETMAETTIYRINNPR